MKAKEHGKYFSEEISFLVDAHGYGELNERFKAKIDIVLSFFPEMSPFWYMIKTQWVRSDAYYLWQTLGGYYG